MSYNTVVRWTIEVHSTTPHAFRRKAIWDWWVEGIGMGDISVRALWTHARNFKQAFDYLLFEEVNDISKLYV